MINNFNITHLALNNIASKKLNAENLATENFNRAFSNKKFKDAYLLARSLQFEIAKNEFENKDATKLKNQLNKTYEILKTELKNLKLSPKQLKPCYSCLVCNDTGFTNGNECDCLKHEKIELLLKANNLNLNKLPCFEQVDFCIYGKNQDEFKTIFEVANNFVVMPDTKKLNLIIFGNTGVGKTYLSECMLNSALKTNKLPIFISSYNLSEMFLTYHTAKLEEKNEIINPYLTCDLLIIDDLGSEKILNNITREYLYIIFSERSKNNLKTVITTNLSPDAIMEVYDERIFSRIVNKRESILINMSGEDLRLKK